MEKRNYSLLCIHPPQEPQGGIYRRQGNRGPGDKPWPEAARATRPYCRENAANAAFPRPYGRAARRVLGQGLSPGPPLPMCL